MMDQSYHLLNAYQWGLNRILLLFTRNRYRHNIIVSIQLSMFTSSVINYTQLQETGFKSCGSLQKNTKNLVATLYFVIILP